MLGIPLFNGTYGGGQAFESVNDNRETLINNVIWQGAYNPTANESVVFSGNYTDMSQTGSLDPAFGPGGCAPGNQCVTNEGYAGSFHLTFSNNYTTAGSLMLAMGPSVNDPNTNRDTSDVHYTGNWLYGSDVALDSCVWHIFNDQGNCLTGGMAVNSGADANCNPTNNGQPYENKNNSLIGTASARLNAYGTGTIPCYDAANPVPTGTTMPIHVYNYTAQKNYLNSPGNQYNSNANTFNPTITVNFCVGSTFTQTDSSSCATTGFTTAPTVSFTLGTLSNGVVQFASTSFTAQYGAVKWLASTSSTTPTPSDSRWSFLPPVSLAAAHGSIVYMWVMDSVCVTSPSTCNASQHISAAATALLQLDRRPSGCACQGAGRAG
jgi:hypothetical protein